MNKARQKIWNKSGGLCWYCGNTLPEKGWHADHFEPLWRQPNNIAYTAVKDESGWSHMVKTESKRPPTHPHRDHIDNLVPTCQSCNILKGANLIEGFRQSILQFINSLNLYHNQYKFAKKYGLVIETQQPVKFWFETQFQEGEKTE